MIFEIFICGGLDNIYFLLAFLSKKKSKKCLNKY